MPWYLREQTEKHLRADSILTKTSIRVRSITAQADLLDILCYDLLSSYAGGRSREKVEIDFPKFGFLRLLHRPVIVRNCDCASHGPLSSGESQSGEVSGADMKELMSTFCRPSLKSSFRESIGKLRILSRPVSNACLFALRSLTLQQYTQLY